MNIAVIQTGGKQYDVREGDTITIEKIPGEMAPGAAVTFDSVLLFDDGEKTSVGTPHLANASVSGEVVEVGKHKKLEILRYKAKSNYHKRKGHRQPFVKVKIASVKG